MATSAGRRSLGRQHFAFFRGCLEGVDRAPLWDRYLYIEGDYSDLRAEVTLRWIREALVTAALRQGDTRAAAVLRRDPRALPSPALQTLEQFSEQFPESFYNESELIAMWQEAHGDSKESRVLERRNRLKDRITEAIVLLEASACEAPSPADSVRSWLLPSVAGALAAVDLNTLAELKAFVDTHGFRWWDRVQGIAEAGAQRLLRWFADHEEALGAIAYKSRVAKTKVDLALVAPAPRFGIVPLERLELPEEFSGRVRRMGPDSLQVPNLLGVETDREAIEVWLRVAGPNKNTVRTYRKEAERLVLWCVFERRCALSSMTVDDCVAYREWLDDLGDPEDPAKRATWAARWVVPLEDWVGKGAEVRHSERWKPFHGALTARSKAHALLIVKGLFIFLRKSRYLPANPWDLVPGREGKARESRFVDRSLSREQWDFALRMVQVYEYPGDRDRIRAILWLGLGCGLRVSEIAGAKAGGIRVLPDGSARLTVTVKGGDKHTVPLPSPAVAALRQYMAVRGLAWRDLLSSPERSLIEKGSGGPVSASWVYKLLKAHFALCAAELDKDKDSLESSGSAAVFRKASTHWLRHSLGTMGVAAGVPVNVIQRVLGHKDLATTSLYVVAQERETAIAMEGFTTGAGENLSPGKLSTSG